MKWFNNLKVGAKLISVLMLVMLVAGIVDLIGVVSMQTIRQDMGTLYSSYAVATVDVAKFGTTFAANRNSVQDILMDPLNDKEYVGAIQANDQELEVTLAKVDKSIQSAEERQLFNNIKDNLKQYKAVRDNVIAMVLAKQQDQAIALFRNEATTSSDNIKSAVDKLLQVKVTGGLQKNNEITGTKAVNTIVIMLVLMVFGTLIALALGLLTSRNIAKPIKQLKEAARKIADGDLEVAVEVRNNDEIGALSLAFREMSSNLHEVIANVNSAAEQVALGAKQLSHSSNALSQGAASQASAVEELNSSIVEISSQTQLNAHNANEANKLAENARINAAEGNKQMQEMLEAMDEINQASSDISKVIKTIDEIAFQTNILALNAAVEAARAGQHGKGFAVVAEEVRNLAVKSAAAAKETTAMIEGSFKKVNKGTRLANQASEALNEIVQGVTKVARLVGNIAVASNAQATGAAQINRGITQVSEVVQTTSATSEEGAASSAELAAQAEALKHQVNRFTFKNRPRLEAAATSSQPK